MEKNNAATIMVAPKGTATITTEEYADLVASKTLLEVIIAAKQVGGYCSDNVIDAICKAFPAPNPKEEVEDA